jgi:hypothetical protein
MRIEYHTHFKAELLNCKMRIKENIIKVFNERKAGAGRVRTSRDFARDQ